MKTNSCHKEEEDCKWHKEETYKSLIQIGISVLKFVLLANGSAAVALLAFIGKVYTPTTHVPDVTASLGYFLAGVFLGGLAHVTAYVTQLRRYNETRQNTNICFIKRHETWLYVSIVLILIAIVSFGFGCLTSVTAISG